MRKRFGQVLSWGSAAVGGLILLGTVVWSVTMVKSGWVYGFGMGFWGANGHDGVWHLALINNLARLSFENPVFAGEALKNYHVGYDLLLGFLVRLTGMGAVTVYFQILPPLMAVLIGYLVYRLVMVWRGSRWQAGWAVFFTYFGGSWGWLVSWWRDRSLGGESMFWAQQAISTLINPPFALSLILLLAGLIWLVKLKEKFSLGWWLGAVFCLGILAEVKIYGGILALAGLGGGLGWEFFAKRKVNRRIASVFLAALVISTALFWLFFRGSQGLLVWQPFWFLETMMGPDRFNWPKFFEAMTTYRMAGVWEKMVTAYLAALAIFLLGNVGTRVVALGDALKRRQWNFAERFMWMVILGGIVLPMGWLQKGTAWNTIQFFYYSLFFLGILAGVVVGEWTEKGKGWLAGAVGAMVVVLTLPGTMGSLKHYLPSRPPAKVSMSEVEALGYLGRLPRGVVLTYPFDREAARRAEANPPRPLYLYESTGYVSAFSDKLVYLEDEVNLEITGYDWRGRRETTLEFFGSVDEVAARKFLDENKIRYIYLVGGQKLRLGEDDLGLRKVFENSEARIYEVILGRLTGFGGIGAEGLEDDLV